MKHILITGPPRIGKTTMIIRLTAELAPFRPAGFYTSEIRDKGVRKGFELIGLGGKRSALSHVDTRSPFRVGKYGVDITAFEDFLASLPFEDPGTKFVVIDEIGKMESLSRKFRGLIENLLNSDKMVVATIALRGDRFIEAIKQRNDVCLFEMTEKNRSSIAGDILASIRKGLSEL